MNKIGPIQSLIDSLNALAHRDDVALHAFRTRASMIIRNVFGEKSGYGAALLNIDFYPRVYYLPLPESHYDEAWNSGKQKTSNLLRTMKEEIEIFPNKNNEEMKARKPKKELAISTKEIREQFLIKLNEMSEGDIDEFIDTMSIGDTLGLDRTTTFNCARYFDQKRYIKHRDEAYGAISITVEGIDEADRIQSRSAGPSSDQGDLPEEIYFSPPSHLDIQKYLARVLRQAKASLWVCDPYMDEKIVEEISNVAASEIRLLTSKQKGSFNQRLAAAKLQYPEKQIEAKIYPKFKCHDRYFFIDQDQVWALGASLNQAGEKATLLSKVNNKAAMQSMIRDFNDWWASATAITTEV
jgi:hypothetical protein